MKDLYNDIQKQVSEIRKRIDNENQERVFFQKLAELCYKVYLEPYGY